MKKILLLLFILLNLTNIVWAEIPKTIKLVENKKVKFRVVVPTNPDWPTKLAANDIVNAVKEAYNVKATIISEKQLNSTKSNLINIHLGLSKYTKRFENQMPKPYGFIVKFVDSKNIIIAGRLLVKDNYNTLDGVTYFLEKFLGVRILMPGELGTVIPKRTKDLTIPTTSFSKVASFPGRSYSGSHGPFYTGKANRHKLEQTINWTRRIGMTVSNVLKMVHNVGNIIDPEIYIKTNPEFFPLIDGKRRFPKKTGHADWKLNYWEPCYTAPGIEKAAAKHVINFFKKNPNLYNYSLSVNDNGNICQCSNCVKKNAHLPKGSESQSYYEWVNKVVKIVKKDFPNHYYGILNYWVTKDMPTNLKLDSSVVPVICEEFKFYVDPNYKARLDKRLKQWDQVASTIGWWDYGFEGSYLVPTYNPKFNAQLLKELYHKHNLRFYFCEWAPGPAWKNIPEIYMMTKLMWDINLDEDKLIDEWFELAVGKEAAIPFKKYYAVWEKFWTKEIIKTSWFKERGDKEIPFLQRRNCSYLKALNYQMIDEALKHIKETVKLAPEGKKKMRAEFLYNWYINAYNKYYLPYLNSLEVTKLADNIQGTPIYHYSFDKNSEKWLPWFHKTMTPKLTFDDSTGFQKAGSLKCDRYTSLPTRMVWYRRPLDFKLKAGKNYRFSVMVKAKDIGPNDNASMTLYLPNGKNSVLGQESNLSKGSLSFDNVLKYNVLKDNKWHKLQVYIAVPKTAWNGDIQGVNCQLEVHTEKYNTVMWFDDFIIEEISDPKLTSLRKTEIKTAKKITNNDKTINNVTGEILGPELIIDGNMEMSENTGLWRQLHTPKIGAKSENFAHSGKRSLHIVSDSNGDGLLQVINPEKYDGLFRVNQKGLEVGKTYKIQIWVKNINISQYEELRVSGSKLKAKLQTKDNNWTKFEFYTTIDKKISTPYVAIGYGTKNSNSYFDDLSIKEVIKAAKK